MSGPIEYAKEVLRGAEQAFRDHGLLTEEECAVCYRMIKGGVHTSDCPVAAIAQAVRRLQAFQSEVSQ